MAWTGNRDLFAKIETKTKGRRFELLAQNTILPRLGFKNLIHLSDIYHNSPFDFAGDRAGQQVVIDITCNWQKQISYKNALAMALRLPLYILMISREIRGFFTLSKLIGQPERSGSRSGP